MTVNLKRRQASLFAKTFLLSAILFVLLCGSLFCGLRIFCGLREQICAVLCSSSRKSAHLIFSFYCTVCWVTFHSTYILEAYHCNTLLDKRNWTTKQKRKLTVPLPCTAKHCFINTVCHGRYCNWYDHSSKAWAYLALAERYLSVHAEKSSNHRERMEKMCFSVIYLPHRDLFDLMINNSGLGKGWADESCETFYILAAGQTCTLAENRPVRILQSALAAAGGILKYRIFSIKRPRR